MALGKVFLAGVCRCRCSNGRQVCIVSYLEPESLKHQSWATLFLPYCRSQAARDVVGDIGVKKIVEELADGAGSGDSVAGDFAGADEIAVCGRDKHFVCGVKIFGTKRLLEDGN